VRPTPHIEAIPGDKLPLRAKYYIAPDQQAEVYSDSFFALGKAHTWNVEIGEALAASVPGALRSAFTSVTRASALDDMADADILVVPVITHFEISGRNFRSTIRVKVVATDGRVLALNQVFEGAPTKGPAGLAWAGGVFGGSEALRRSAELAFHDVMPKIVAQLRSALANP
jgi:hypothetical protein